MQTSELHDLASRRAEDTDCSGPLCAGGQPCRRWCWLQLCVLLALQVHDAVQKGVKSISSQRPLFPETAEDVAIKDTKGYERLRKVFGKGLAGLLNFLAGDEQAVR